ncbi:MAG: dCTP deaminase [Synergistaceae bacterium]|nr:dCTP deaminase [Synergistaceae bacterium]
MAVLSDGRLIEMIADGKLKLIPFLLENIQPASIDLRLDKLIKLQVGEEIIDLSEDSSKSFKEVVIQDEYILDAGAMILGQTLEYIGIPRDCNATIHNRSSIARDGVDVSTGSYINPAYEGQLPLIIRNIGRQPVRLFPGIRICQMELSDITPSPIRDYSQRKDSKYFGEFDSLVSKIHLDEEIATFKKKGSEGSLADFIVLELRERRRNVLDVMPEELKRELGLL